MRRESFLRMVALALCVALISLSPGPAFTSGTDSRDKIELLLKRPDPIHFSEIEYSRPDIEADTAEIEDLVAAIGECGSFDELVDNIVRASEIMGELNTMATYVMIRASLNRNDEFWVEEERVIMMETPPIEKASQEYMRTLYASPYREQIESEISPHFFDYIDFYGYMTDETAPLFSREAELVSEFNAERTNRTVKSGDTEYAYSDLLDISGSVAGTIIFMKWFDEAGPDFMERYIELTKLRMEMADVLGYDSYAELALVTRNMDYTVEDMRRYLDEAAVVFSDNLLDIIVSVPSVEVQAELDDYLSFFRDVLSGLSDEAADSFDFMMEYGAYDFDQSPDKDPGAYTTYLNDYGLPFLNAPYDGGLTGAGYIAHEFGHYYTFSVADFINIPSTDVLEIYSQAFELFTSNHYGELFGDEAAADIQKYIVLNQVFTIAMTLCYAQIELDVYALGEDELTVEKLSEIAANAYAKFGMGIYPESMIKYEWVIQPQIFQSPMYSVTYATSALTSIDIWRMSLEDEGAAFDFMTGMIKTQGSPHYLEMLGEFGLKTPFDGGRIGDLMEFVESKFGLVSYDDLAA